MKAILRRVLPGPVRRALRRAFDGSRDTLRRLRWLAHARRWNGVGLARFDGYRVAYRIGSVDLDVIRHSFDSDIFLREVPELVLREDAVILDVGAHIGTFTLLAARRAPRGQVFAVEASRETHALLVGNVALNHLDNVTAEHLALADRDGEVLLHHDPGGNYGHSITKALSDAHETVAASTLPRYLAERGIERVDLVKFNCEGAEFPILLSTPRETLRRFGKMIVLYHGDLVGRPDAADLRAHLEAAGFSTRLANVAGDRGWIIATRT